MRLSLRHFLGSTLWCGLLMAISGTVQVGATVQEAEFLRKVAEQYVRAQFQNRSDDIRVQVEAGRLDERRDYGGKCEGYLTAQLRGNEIRTTSQVIISCDQPGNKYTLYIPVRVSILTPAFIVQPSYPAQQKIHRAVEVLCKFYKTFGIWLSFSVVPAVYSLFRKFCLFFKSVFSYIEVPQYERELFGKGRAGFERRFVRRIFKPEQKICRALKIIGEFYKRIYARQSVAAEQRKYC